MQSENKNIKESNDVFSSVVLNQGAEWSENVVHDELYFPKLSSKKSSINDVQHLWMSGFLHHEKTIQEILEGKEAASFLCLPGSSVHPEAHKHIQEQRNDKIEKSKTINDATLNHGPKCRMTDEEKRRLDDIHKRLKDKKSKQREPKSKLDALAPYLSTNKQIRRVLQHNRNPIKIQMRSKRLEKYFLQNRREAEACIMLQCFWRRVLSYKQLNLRYRQKVSATQIQATFRGTKARVWVTEWKKKKVFYAVRCQSHLRRRVHSNKWSRRRKIEYKCAVTVQSITRSFLVKSRLERIKKEKTATIIQGLYRGFKTRSQLFHHKLCQNASIIQSRMRLFLSKRRFRFLSKSKHSAAEVISRCWRGHESRRTRTRLLRERNIERKENFVRRLIADGKYYSSVIHEIPYYSQPPNTQQMSELERLENELSTTESQCLELKRSIAQMTPRSVEQGWEEQSKRSIQNFRDKATKLKQDIVFKVKKNIKRREAEDHERNEKIAHLTSLQTVTKEWSEEMINEVWTDKQLHSSRNFRRTSRQSIADEKRRWKVDFKTPSGKPLKALKRESDNKRRSQENYDYADLMERIYHQRIVNQLQQYKGIYKQN